MCAKLHELLLEVVELDLEVFLVLAPEGRRADFCGGLAGLCQRAHENLAYQIHHIPSSAVVID